MGKKKRIVYRDKEDSPQGWARLDNCIFNLLFGDVLSLTERVVLCYLVRMLIGRRGIKKYRKVDFVFLSYVHIAKATGLNFRTVKKDVESLKKLGYIFVLPIRPFKDNRWATMEVRLCYENLKEAGNKISVFNNKEKE